MHPEVGEGIGLGTKEELQRHTEGYSAVVPLGEHETMPMPMGKGVPQGSVQGVHAAITAAIPITSLIRDCYGAATAEPMGAPSQMWVDDTVVMLQRDPDYPLQGTLVDQQAYFEWVMRVALAVKKMQYATTGKPQTLLFITPEKAREMAGVPWMQAYEKALGGPLMVGCVKGVSMVEVVRKVMMAIDISIITDTVVDIAILDLSQYYDNIPQDAHPEVGEPIGLGTKEELQ